MNKARPDKQPPLTLASGSAIRATILRNAGLAFNIVRPGVDEAAIKKACEANGAPLEKTALELARAKCLAVAPERDGLVIGSDQILEFRGAAFDKPASMAKARERLVELAGATHSLINATVLARDGEIIWRHLERPLLTMRPMTETEIDRYLGAAGEDVLASVGGYQLELHGARLFTKIEGDYFAVLGLALFPLLAVLRQEGAIDF